MICRTPDLTIARLKRTDEDVIEVLYRFEGNLIYTEYFSKGRGLVSSVTPEHVLIQQE